MIYSTKVHSCIKLQFYPDQGAYHNVISAISIVMAVGRLTSSSSKKLPECTFEIGLMVWPEVGMIHLPTVAMWMHK